MEIIEFTFEQIFSWQTVDYVDGDGKWIDCDCMYLCLSHRDYDCHVCCSFHKNKSSKVDWFMLMENKREDEHYPELLKSIKHNGIIRPPSVAYYKDFFKHYDGHHRMTAAYDLGYKTVPYIAVEMNALEVWEDDCWPDVTGDIPGAWVQKESRWHAVTCVTA